MGGRHPTPAPEAWSWVNGGEVAEKGNRRTGNPPLPTLGSAFSGLNWAGQRTRVASQLSCTPPPPTTKMSSSSHLLHLRNKHRWQGFSWGRVEESRVEPVLYSTAGYRNSGPGGTPLQAARLDLAPSMCQMQGKAPSPQSCSNPVKHPISRGRKLRVQEVV